MPVRNVWGHRRQSVRRLLSSRQYAKAESAVGASAMLEMPRTNLGGKGLAGRSGENLSPLHKARWIEKTGRSALALKSNEYRLMAEEWEARAKQAPPDLRAEFRTIAAQWRQLAADTETIERIRRRIEELEGA